MLDMVYTQPFKNVCIGCPIITEDTAEFQNPNHGVDIFFTIHVVNVFFF